MIIDQRKYIKDCRITPILQKKILIHANTDDTGDYACSSQNFTEKNHDNS